MKFSTEPIEGVYGGFNYFMEAIVLDTQSVEPNITEFLLLVNTIVNAFVPITISLLLLAGIAYLVRYTFSPNDSESSRVSIRGATRAFVAVFITVNIWTIIRLIQDIYSISLNTAYFIFFFSFLIFGFWSLFSIGDTLIALITRLFNWAVEKIIALIIPHLGESGFATWFKNTKRETRHFIVLVGILILVSIFTIGKMQLQSYAGDNVEQFEAREARNNTTSIPLGGASGAIDQNTFSNAEYGFAVSFPQTWTISTTSMYIVKATRDSAEVHVQAFTVPPAYQFSANLEGLGKDATKSLVEYYIDNGYGITDLHHSYYNNFRTSVVDYPLYPFYFIGLTLSDPQTNEAISSEVRVLFQNNRTFYELSMYVSGSYLTNPEYDEVWNELWGDIIPSVSFTKTGQN